MLLLSLITTTLGTSAAALGIIEGVSDALADVARFSGSVPADDPARHRATAVGYMEKRMSSELSIS